MNKTISKQIEYLKIINWLIGTPDTARKIFMAEDIRNKQIEQRKWSLQSKLRQK